MIQSIRVILIGTLFAAGSAFAVMVESDFKDLDKDRDGYISYEEARGDVRVSRTWSDYDHDADSRLSEAEFSALEEGEDEFEPWYAWDENSYEGTFFFTGDN